MIKKIIILGSTGSVGKSTLNIIRNNKKKFNIILLSTNKNVNKLVKQAKEFKVKNIIIFNKKKYDENKLRLFKEKKIKVYNNLKSFYQRKKIKVDFTMSAISGLNGLEPTLTSIKYTKRIAIANKESLICAWNLIQKKLKFHKTEFIPVDSEHFSIWSLIKNTKIEMIEKIYITASGGPFLKMSVNKLKTVTPKLAIKHPMWSMGKKISIDSATMMNKVFEIIEAKKIFNVSLDKFNILIHPDSYVHSIVKLKNGLIKIMIHDTDMSIPIFNSLYNEKKYFIDTKKIDFKILNNLNLQNPKINKFPVINILKKLPKRDSLYETVIVSANDQLVELFLHNKIKFIDIYKNLQKILNLKIFIKYKHILPKNLKQILKLNEFVRLKTKSLSVLSR
jgi:1-deoxy-D-xylulose-5-phosphate reductoisomerase